MTTAGRTYRVKEVLNLLRENGFESIALRGDDPNKIVVVAPALVGRVMCVGFEGVGEEESAALLKELHDWQTRDEFLYRHEWEPGMLVMWDNRSVLHRATGGYEGYDRLLHRTTIGATA